MTAIIPTQWSSNNSVPVTVEQALGAIQNSRRRHILIIIDNAENARSVGNLANEIAAIESDKDVAELDAQDRKRVYIGLYQTHLDTLDEINAISYDDRAKEVRANNTTAALADLIRYIESTCEP